MPSGGADQGGPRRRQQQHRSGAHGGGVAQTSGVALAHSVANTALQFLLVSRRTLSALVLNARKLHLLLEADRVSSFAACSGERGAAGGSTAIDAPHSSGNRSGGGGGLPTPIHVTGGATRTSAVVACLGSVRGCLPGYCALFASRLAVLAAELRKAVESATRDCLEAALRPAAAAATVSRNRLLSGASTYVPEGGMEALLAVCIVEACLTEEVNDLSAVCARTQRVGEGGGELEVLLQELTKAATAAPSTNVAGLAAAIVHGGGGADYSFGAPSSRDRPAALPSSREEVILEAFARIASFLGDVAA